MKSKNFISPGIVQSIVIIKMGDSDVGDIVILVT